MFFIARRCSWPCFSQYAQQRSCWRRSTQIVPASDARFRYEGRFDFANSNAPVVIWQASRISLDFSGDTIGLLFEDAKGQNFFNARVDGTNQVIAIPEGIASQPITLSGFGDGRHHLTLFKRSEASAGTVQFCGVELLPMPGVVASTAPLQAADGIHRRFHHRRRVQ